MAAYRPDQHDRGRLGHSRLDWPTEGRQLCPVRPCSGRVGGTGVTATVAPGVVGIDAAGAAVECAGERAMRPQTTAPHSATRVVVKPSR